MVKTTIGQQGHGVSGIKQKLVLKLGNLGAVVNQVGLQSVNNNYLPMAIQSKPLFP